MGFAGHVAHSCASGALNIDALFFILGWALSSFHKKCVGSGYAKLVFWHPVGSAGHVAHFGASGAQNVDALFLMLGWTGVDATKSVS
jgi:hypothetical protein